MLWFGGPRRFVHVSGDHDNAMKKLGRNSLFQRLKYRGVQPKSILAPIQRFGSQRKLLWESNRAPCNSAILL
jgi:hypothetical protein